MRTWCLSGSTTLGIQEGMIREPQVEASLPEKRNVLFSEKEMFGVVLYNYRPGEGEWGNACKHRIGSGRDDGCILACSALWD